MKALYGVGLWLADSLGPRWLLGLEVVAVLHAAVASMVARTFAKFYPGMWWPLFGFLAVGVLALASKTRAHEDKEERMRAEKAVEDARADAHADKLQAISDHKRMTAGNLSRLLKIRYENTGDTGPVQEAFLQLAVDSVKQFLGLDPKDTRITANWTIPINGYSQWEVVAYDRNQTNRHAGGVRPISPGIPGAAESYLTGRDMFVKDTQDQEVAQHILGTPPYRSVVSVPARILNCRGEQNVVIDGRPNRVCGVLNVDCREPEVLRPDVADTVRDIAYLLALLEHLRGDDDGR